MPKTDSLYIRIDPKIKSTVEAIYARYGLRVSDAINIFLYQSVNANGLPFDMREPRYSPEIETAMQEAVDIASGKIPSKGYASARELFDELDAEMEAGEGC